ncbi:MAG: amidohydrolase, partial [Gammaproteobacteria bacterium]|nr:amidohydrolase [Gammaproteobacteria bacterium]
EAGARGSGSEVEINWANVDYLDLNTNWPLAAAFQGHGESLGREFLDWQELGGAGSTDMGNVSHRVPSIHPMLAAAPRDVVIHNPEFARWARSGMGDAAAIDGAKLLAMTASDFLLDGDLRDASAQAFRIAKGLTGPCPSTTNLP